MRELKFRAWDSFTKKMVGNGFHIIGETTMFKCIEQYADEHPNPKENTSLLRLNDFILMQFTGIKDKNGVEIYEDDIINDGTCICSIEWRDFINVADLDLDIRVIGWCRVWKDKDISVFGYDNEIDFEVVGNIHQNPDLLIK